MHSLLIKLILLVFLFNISGCLGLQQYARVYADSVDAPEGVEPLRNFEVRIQSNKKIDLEMARCLYLRNQLYAAFEKARSHYLNIWVNPLMWPFHLLTLWTWPVGETKIIQEIFRAARQIEISYQSSDKEFLSACRVVRESALGKTFATEEVRAMGALRQ